MAQHDSQTPLSSRDLWATPNWLYRWLNTYYQFGIDLAAGDDNSHCAFYYDKQQNALSRNWKSDSLDHNYNPVGFLNPPYSKIAPWISCAILEQSRGFTTAMVIPTPNGESYYEGIFDHATSITFINGRVGFIASCDYEKVSKSGKVTQVKKGDEVSGNTRGTCVFEFSPFLVKPNLRVNHVNRDFLINEFGDK